MSDLNPCKLCGSPAVEQIRSEHVTQLDLVTGKAVEVELDDPDALDDYRIACSAFPKCVQYLGWAKPTLKEAARLRKLWNEMN